MLSRLSLSARCYGSSSNCRMELTFSSPRGPAPPCLGLFHNIVGSLYVACLPHTTLCLGWFTVISWWPSSCPPAACRVWDLSLPAVGVYTPVIEDKSPVVRSVYVSSPVTSGFSLCPKRWSHRRFGTGTERLFIVFALSVVKAAIYPSPSFQMAAADRSATERGMCCVGRWKETLPQGTRFHTPLIRGR